MVDSTATAAFGLVCHRLSGDLDGVGLASFELPPPGPGQALVAVSAAALNFPDLLMTQGGYQHRPDLPFVLGMEGAGRVVALGEGSAAGIEVGARVVFNGKTGACATHALLPLDTLSPAPPAFDDAQAAAYPVGAVTAWAGLVERGGLRAGEWLLVHGASGGMGMAAVQLGVRLGARVIATARSAEAHDLLRRLGAVEVLTPAPGWHERVKAVTAGRGADLVFDPVGGDLFDESLRAAAWAGRVLIVGFTSGRIADMPTNRALIKSLSILGVRAGEMGRRDPVLGQRMQAAIWALAAHPDMAPVIGARFRLADGLDALRALRERRFAGKIAIETGEEGQRR